jgi:kinesin family protein 2/24
MTRGVSVEQVKAFRSKMWQLHIDSQRVGGVSKTPKTNTTKSTENVSKTTRSSSRDLDSSAAAVPFKERIRPGMVVSWKETSDPDAALSTPEFMKLAFVLCPFEAVPGTVNKSLGDILNPAKSEHANVDGNGSQKSTQYLCALVTPAIMAEAYEVSLWQQVVVDVGMMDGEVFLEYDAATRYYYISV